MWKVKIRSASIRAYTGPESMNDAQLSLRSAGRRRRAAPAGTRARLTTSIGTARPCTVTDSSSPGKYGGADGRPRADVAEAHGVGRRAEHERAAEEDRVDRADDRAAVGGRGGEGEQAHAGQPLGDLLGGEAALGGVDAQQVLAGGRVAGVEELLERREVLGGLVHQAALARGPSRRQRGADGRAQGLGGRVDHRREAELRASASGARRGRPCAARRSARPRRSTPAASACAGDARARARDRQRDREVGARLVDPDAAGDVDEHVRAADADARVAAEHGEHEREAVAVDPVQARRGGTSSVGDTSAWTSTSSGREPSIEASTTEPGARVASPTKRARRVGTSTSPPQRISNTPGLVRRAEPVLQRAERAVRALALALELQHAVDEVLEHARARERALLRDVADEQHRGAGRLGEAA